MGFKCFKCEKEYQGNVLRDKCPNCGNEDLTQFIRIDEAGFGFDPIKHKRDKEWLESLEIK